MNSSITKLTSAKSISLALSTLAVITILGVGVTTEIKEAKAYACKSYPTQAVGIRKGKHRAKTVAKNGWRNNVKSQFGVPWSVWSIAKAKTMHCIKINVGSTKKWRCLSSAKPCLYVVK